MLIICQEPTTITSMLIEASPEGNPANSAILVTLMLFDEKLHGQLQRAQYPFPIRSSLQPFFIPELAIQSKIQASSSGGTYYSSGQQPQPSPQPGQNTTIAQGGQIGHSTGRTGTAPEPNKPITAEAKKD